MDIINKAHWKSDGNNLRLSMPISKIDQERRIVSGFATLDNLDKQNDIVTSDASIKAFAVENSLLFKEHSGAIIKSMLVNPNSFRTDTLNEYLNYSFDSDGRIKKRNEHYLESLFYQKSEERVL